MADPAPPRGPARPVDEAALCRIRRRLTVGAQPPWLHGEVARRMAERLSLFRQPPRVVVDWWPRLGGGHRALAAACPGARIDAVEEMPAAPASWWTVRRWTSRPALDESAVGDGSAGLVWSNMALHLVADPEALLARWHRALSVGGFLMFSTLGSGTMASLATLYRARGWGPPFAPFTDMHDLGDMLVQTGFADPVMDQETITLNWADASALLAELRTLGGNADRLRYPGLRTPRWREALVAALDEGGGRPALGFEIVYGHAFKVAPKARVAERTEVPLDLMRAMVRGSRQPD